MLFLSCLAACLVAGCGAVPGRPDLRLAELPTEELAGLVREGDVQVYRSLDLGQYLGGGADLYRAYDFVRLVVARYRTAASNAVYTVELCEFETPEDAYGMYSESRGGARSTIGQESTYVPGLLSTWKGRVWLKISTESRAAECSDSMAELARALAGRIPPEGQRPAILDRLPREGLVEDRVVYFHAQVTLNHLYFLGPENALLLSDDTDAVLAEYRRGEAFPYLLLVQYQSPVEADEAAVSFARSYALSKTPRTQGVHRFPTTTASASDALRPDDTYVAWQAAGPYVAVCLEATSRQQALELVREALADQKNKGTTT